MLTPSLKPVACLMVLGSVALSCSSETTTPGGDSGIGGNTVGGSTSGGNTMTGGAGGLGIGGMGVGGTGTGGMGTGGAGIGGSGIGGTGTGGTGIGGSGVGGTGTGGTGVGGLATGGVGVGGVSVQGGAPPSGGSGGSGQSSCTSGVDTGSPCDPAVDVEVCHRSDRDCTCGANSEWSCTPTGETGGAGTGGVGTGGIGEGGTGEGGTGEGGTGEGGTGEGGTPVFGEGPCDIYAAANKPCIAAYSMTRVLLSTYSGPLYQVRKGAGLQNTGTGGTTQDIMAVEGYGDSATQESFCGNETCTVSMLYDQTGNGNDLKVAPAGCYDDGSANLPDYESDAKKRSLMVGGHKVYALYTNPREGYRYNEATNMTNNADQTVYMVADGKHWGDACCFDFGNASRDNCNQGVMNAIMFGTGWWGTGAGNGPWFAGDFEGGVWTGGSGPSTDNNPNSPSMPYDFSFGVLKSSDMAYAIRVANAQSGGDLITTYDGRAPKQLNAPGGIILGIGGDNSNHSYGTFFEGAIVASRVDDATDAAVLANIQAAGYEM